MDHTAADRAAELMMDLSAMQRRMNDLEKENNVLNQQNGKLIRSVEDMDTLLGEWQHQGADIHPGSLVKSAQSVSQEKDRESELRQARKELCRLEDTILDLQRLRETASQQARKSEEQLIAKTEEIHELTTDLASLQSKALRFEEANHGLIDKARELERKIESCRVECQTLQNKSDKQTTELLVCHKEKAELEVRIQTINSLLKEQKEYITSLESANGKYDVENQRLLSNIDLLHRQTENQKKELLQTRSVASLHKSSGSMRCLEVQDRDNITRGFRAINQRDTTDATQAIQLHDELLAQELMGFYTNQGDDPEYYMDCWLVGEDQLEYPGKNQ
ncbi:hypothetical protein S40288_10419, partial [Stachybotrys chartarum IBT 40288]